MNLELALAAGIASGTVLLFAAIGELFTERSGIINLGVQGMMFVGALVGIKVGLEVDPWLGIILVMSLVPLLIYVVFLTDFRLAMHELALPVVAIVAIFVPMLWAGHSTTKSAIGLQGDTVTLRDHAGNEVAIPMARVSYSKSAIAGPDSAVFLGQHHLALYDREALETQVFPRLTGAKSISAWDMQMTLIRMGHPQGVATVVAIVGAFIAGVAYALIR